MRGNRVFLTAALVFALGAVGAAAQSAFHFEMHQSAPAADATVAPPAEIRLWFTEAPEANSVSIRLVDAGGAQVATTDAATDPESEAVYFVKPTSTLGPGRYTVAWRGLGDDGHPATGNFGFTVSAQ
jgi:methionine-rich copper-binding protein CopC